MREHRISSVEANNKRHSFAVTIGGSSYEVPYSLAHIEGVIESVAPDGEIGNAGFTWVTRDGDEGTMLAEEVLWIHEDPEVQLPPPAHGEGIGLVGQLHAEGDVALELTIEPLA